MVQRLRKWFVVVLLVFCIGTPWGLLQSVAWLGMLYNYARATTFAQAVILTFDGKHPCRLCHFVQQGRAEERQQKKSLPRHNDTLQLGLPPVTFSLFHPPMPRDLATATPLPGARIEAPPRPPPRCA